MIVQMGLDLGSTGGKFALSTGYVDSIPAVIGTAEEIWQWQKDYYQVTHAGKQVFVGKAAMEQCGEPLFALENNKMNRATVEPLLLAVLARVCESLGDESPTIDLVATLPFDATKEQKNLMTKMLDSVSGNTIHARIGGERVKYQPTIRHRSIQSEGYMGWCNYILCDDGKILKDREQIARQRVFIGDLGLYHFNLLVSRNMALIGKPTSRSTALGLSVAYIALSRELGGIKTWEVDRLVTDGEVDGSIAFEKLATLVNQEVRNLENRLGYTFPVYYWTGGGATATYKWLDQGKKILAEDGPLDNAKGALKVAQRAWLEEVC